MCVYMYVLMHVSRLHSSVLSLYVCISMYTYTYIYVCAPSYEYTVTTTVSTAAAPGRASSVWYVPISSKVQIGATGK